VEDGRPFCPQCRAPQIHVLVPETEVAAESAVPTYDPSPETSVETLLAASQSRTSASGSSMDRGTAVRAALKAGLLGFLIGGFIPFLGIVLAGALAVFFYRRESGFGLPIALGSRLGGAAGVVAVGISSAFLSIWILLFHGQEKYLEFLKQATDKAGVSASDPQFQAVLHSLSTPLGLAITFLLGMVVGSVLASVGGALASLFLRPRKPQA
jgi:hypothetical protein